MTAHKTLEVTCIHYDLVTECGGNCRHYLAHEVTGHWLYRPRSVRTRDNSEERYSHDGSRTATDWAPRRPPPLTLPPPPHYGTLVTLNLIVAIDLHLPPLAPQPRTPLLLHAVFYTNSSILLLYTP